MFVPKQSQRTFTQDHQQGKTAEEKCHQALQTLTKNPLIHHKYQFAPFDFESETTLIEMKDRNCYYDSYPTTMINGLKVVRASQQKKRVFFAFKFYDGLYYIRYKPEKFAKYETKSFKLDDRVDYKEIERERFYIPKEDLKCLIRFNDEPHFLPDD